MNRSDSEEMAGRLLAAGCAEAPSLETADLVVINTCAIREAAEQKVIGRQGQLGRLKAANPGMRVVLTGCAVREPDRAGLRRRFPAVDLFLRPDEEPELVDRLGLASAQAPSGSCPARRPSSGGRVGAADHLPGTRAGAVAGGAVRRESAISAWLPIVYGCDKTCTYCIVPFSRGPERSRPFDEIVDEARSLAAAGYREVTLLGQNVNSYGHDLPPEPRFADVDTERWAGRRLDLHGRPDLAALIRAIDGDPDRGRRAGDPAPAVRDVAPVGPQRSADRGDGRVPVGLRAPPPAGPVRRRRGAPADGPPVHDRALPRAAGPDPRGGARDRDLDRRDRRVLRRDRRPVPARRSGSSRRSATTRSSRPPTRERPGTPATHLADDVPPDVKRRRLNELLALQEAIGLERNRAWVGPRGRGPRRRGDAAARTTTTTTRRSSRRGARRPRVSGRSREHKLVHLAGGPELVGRLVTARIDHAGPYALPGKPA